MAPALSHTWKKPLARIKIVNTFTKIHMSALLSDCVIPGTSPGDSGDSVLQHVI